ncbi:MAG: MoxR family ATPase [Candidatus Kapabacteria bacterium]|nr:MoxR family ATPase [Candidatus Kapabacteria bacterium]
MFESRIDLSALKTAVESIRAEVAKIIVGQEQMVDLLIAAILADGHVLIEGVPGVAKTMTAKLISRTLNVDFNRIQFTPDLMPSDVLGTMVFNPKEADFGFKQGPIFSNIVLVDEINRAPAKTQAALLEVMEERQVTVDGVSHIMSYPFFVIATQNPVEHEGTYRLPEAQLDRFVFKINVGYPKLDEEVNILAGYHTRKGVNNVESITSVLNAADLQQYRVVIQSLHVEERIMRYIAQIVHATRNSGSLYLGASPRASLGILTTSKAIAAMNGMDFVTPEHVREVVTPVLRHRIQLTPEREMEGASPDEVIKEIVEKTEVPR